MRTLTSKEINFATNFWIPSGKCTTTTAADYSLSYSDILQFFHTSLGTLVYTKNHTQGRRDVPFTGVRDISNRFLQPTTCEGKYFWVEKVEDQSILIASWSSLRNASLHLSHNALLHFVTNVPLSQTIARILLQTKPISITRLGRNVCDSVCCIPFLLLAENEREGKPVLSGWKNLAP